MRSTLTFIIALGFITTGSTPSVAQAPDNFSFQGSLTDSLGTPLDTIVTIASKLFAGKTLVHEQIHNNVDVINGVFNLIITNTDTVAFDTEIEIGIRVGNNVEMTPRTPILMAPYAQSLISFRVYPKGSGFGPNIIGGHANNNVGAGLTGASVLGGGNVSNPNWVLGNNGTVTGGVGNTAHAGAAVGGGQSNQARGNNSFVGAGKDNIANGTVSVVAGGENNEANGTASVVGGGLQNIASGIRSVIPGGKGNVASGIQSFAAGELAAAVHNGSFVWQDASAGANDTLFSTATNQFLVRAAGGVSFLTATAPNVITGAFLASGASGWNAVSSRSAKTDFVEVDPKEYLRRIAGMDIQQWRYRTEDPNVTHVGPFAEDFLPLSVTDQARRAFRQ